MVAAKTAVLVNPVNHLGADQGHAADQNRRPDRLQSRGSDP